MNVIHSRVLVFKSHSMQMHGTLRAWQTKCTNGQEIAHLYFTILTAIEFKER